MEGGRNEGQQGPTGMLKAGAHPADGAGRGGAVIPQGVEGWSGEDEKIGGLAGARAPTL